MSTTTDTIRDLAPHRRPERSDRAEHPATGRTGHHPGAHPTDPPAPPHGIDPETVFAALRAALQDISELSGQADRALAGVTAGDPHAAAAIDSVARAAIPRWHFAMLNDHERNDAFAVALERQVPTGAHVLDIGSGTGLLAMLAVQAGAAHVTTCEANPVLADIARRIVAAHGMTDAVTVLPCLSSALRVGRELARPADVLVSEIVDCGLIGEGLFPSLRHARAELLAPDAVVIPGHARLDGCLVTGPSLARLNRVTAAAGFDVRALNRLATVGHFPVRLSTWPHRIMSAPSPLARFDLARDPLHDGTNTVTFTADAAGEVDGVVAWFTLDLGAGVQLRNAPDNLASHWMQALVLFDEPLVVEAGEPVEVALSWQGPRLAAVPTTAVRP